jgi:hypothetical protein
MSNSPMLAQTLSVLLVSVLMLLAGMKTRRLVLRPRRERRRRHR